MSPKLAFTIAIILHIISCEMIIVLGDIGTASSYHPPYTREYTRLLHLTLQNRLIGSCTFYWLNLVLKCCAATRCNGNRQDQFPSGNLFVQVSEGLWDNGAACGRRYRLRCLSGSNRPCKEGTVDVRVVDFCTKRPCPSTIVMSSDAFAAVSRSPDAKINIEFIQ